MVERRRQPGFSLMEVLFAVVVLAMGLVFVAAQFPLGIINTAKVADATLNTIDAHNSQVMIKLQLGGIEDPCGVFFNDTNGFIKTDGNIHLLPKPNIRVADGAIVMDDPEQNYFLPPGTTAEYRPYYYGNGVQAGEIPPFMKSEEYNPLLLQDELAPSNIGMMVSPPVDESDREVVENVPEEYYVEQNPTVKIQQRIQYVDPAIYNVASERPYSWLALYRSGQAKGVYNLYIFTLRNHNKNARYAMQKNPLLAFGDGTPEPTDDSQYDRKFPVPWRIDLDPDKPMLPGNDRFRLYDHTLNIQFANKLVEILRKGSILMDALPSPLIPNDPVGNVYEVTEITQDEIGKWWVRLRSPLNDPMISFWVIPPAIEERLPSSNVYSDVPPVVGVTQKVVRF